MAQGTAIGGCTEDSHVAHGVRGHTTSSAHVAHVTACEGQTLWGPGRGGHGQGGVEEALARRDAACPLHGNTPQRGPSSPFVVRHTKHMALGTGCTGSSLHGAPPSLPSPPFSQRHRGTRPWGLGPGGEGGGGAVPPSPTTGDDDTSALRGRVLPVLLRGGCRWTGQVHVTRPPGWVPWACGG